MSFAATLGLPVIGSAAVKRSIFANIIILCLLAPAAAAIHETDRDESSYEFTGESEYLVKSGNGELSLVSRNEFSFVRDKCMWRLVIRVVGEGPGTASEVADDGTNAYVLSHGASGYIPVGRHSVHIDYRDSAHMYDAGTWQPKSHGLGVWLLLAGSCTTNFSQMRLGDLLGLISAPTPVPYSYLQDSDPTQNTFGPSLLRVYVGNERDLSQRFPIAKLTVNEARLQDGQAIPTKAVLEAFDVINRNADGTPILIWMYRMNIAEARKIEPRQPIRPELKNPTRTFDRRNGQIVEYVSDSWKTFAEAQKTLRDGNIRIVQQPIQVSASPPRRFFVLIAMVFMTFLATLFVWKMGKPGKTKETK